MNTPGEIVPQEGQTRAVSMAARHSWRTSASLLIALGVLLGVGLTIGFHTFWGRIDANSLCEDVGYAWHTPAAESIEVVIKRFSAGVVIHEARILCGPVPHPG